MEIVQRRIQFDDDPENFVTAYADSTSDLKNCVMLARKEAGSVHISHEDRMTVAAKGEMLLFGRQPIHWHEPVPQLGARCDHRSRAVRESARFHLIVLEGGKIRCRAWNSTGRRFEAALADLKEASGKSLIVESLKTLQRAMLRKGSMPGDRLVIASDGLASPAPAERPAQTLHRLRHALGRIVRRQHSIAWIHPPSKRGLARWLPALCSDLQVKRLELRTGLLR